jgi:hypothetical protein
MSDIYAIKASTLTTMGNVVRSKVFGVDSVNEEIKYTWDNINPSSILIKPKIPAKKYKVIIDDVIMSDNGQYAIQIYNDYATGSMALHKVFNKTAPLSLPIEVEITNTKIEMYGTVLYDGSFELSIKVIPLDENGEEYKYTPLEMVEKINGLSTIPEEAFTITGDCSYRFPYNAWNWFINQYGDKITTKDISAPTSMFNYSSSLTEIPFDINIKKDATNFSNIFYNANKLKSIPYIIGPERTPPTYSYNCLNLNSMFYYCGELRSIPNDYFWKIVPNKDFWDKHAELTTQQCSNLFNACYSLRELPDISMLGGAWTSPYTSLYYNTFYNCHILEKIENLLVCGTFTSNAFNGSFYGCHRLKNFTFQTNEDGTPKTAKWKSQTIDLSSNVGFTNNINNIVNYNSGITADKRVKDDATYQALKNDPDWFATDINYSRYNHDSAVETINSLPDCSAYGTNTIKFKGASGALTDGGAINTLTEEEIAVAAAKGWTVTLS